MSVNKYSHSQKIKTSSKKPLILATIAVLLLAAIGGGAYYKVQRDNSRDADVAATDEPKLQDKVDLSPPSAEEEKSGDDIKQEIIKQQEQQTPRTENNKKAVTPVVTSAYVSNGTVSVRGFVTGTIETNGSCNFVFSKNGQTVTKTSAVVANASTTDCKPLNFPASELPSGTSDWKVKLQYSSSTAEGTSTEQTLTVN
jgi:hypothetical protein